MKRAPIVALAVGLLAVSGAPASGGAAAEPRMFPLRSQPGIVVRRVSGGLALDNRSRSGTFAHVNVFVPLGTRPTHLDYRLTVATTRLRPRR